MEELVASTPEIFTITAQPQTLPKRNNDHVQINILKPSTFQELSEFLQEVSSKEIFGISFENYTRYEV